jgi:hypothetical protein
MEPIIQPSNPLMTNTECKPAANPPQPEQPFNEVLLKQYATVEKSTDPKEKIAEETIPSNFLPIFPTQLSQNELNSPDPMMADLLSQPLNQEENIIQNQQLSFTLSLLGGVGNLEKNTLSSTPGQVKSDPAASESLVGQDLSNILNSKEGLLQAGALPMDGQTPANEWNPQDLKDLNQPGRTVDPKNIRWEGNGSLLDHPPHSSAEIIPVPSPFDEGGTQPEGTFPRSELNPNLLNQKGAIIAHVGPRSPMFFENDANFSSTPNDQKVISDSKHPAAPESRITHELPGEQKKPIVVVETGIGQKPWPAQEEPPDFHQRMDEKAIGSIRNNGETKDASPKSGSNVNFPGKTGTIPSLDTNLPMFLEFAEKWDPLLRQNSTGAGFLERSLNEEFGAVGNSSMEKKGLKIDSGAEDQPAKDSDGINELRGSPKPQSVVEEAGIPQKSGLAKTEHPDLYQRIAEKIIWSIRNNEQNIRLTLAPPQLGNLYIEIHKNKEEIKVTLWADNSITKEILENNRFQLQKTLEGDGFKLEKYEVFVQKDMGAFQGNDENHFSHDKGSRTQSLEIQESELSQPLEFLPGIIRAGGKSRYVDRFV